MSDNKLKTSVVLSAENRFLDAKYYNQLTDYKKVNGVYAWGNDNLAPNKIQDLKYSSPTHAALIDLKYFMLDNYTILPKDIARYETYNQFSPSELDTVIKSVIKDYIIFNQFTLKICPTEAGVKFIKHIPVKSFRYSTTTNEEGDPTEVVISKDWANIKIKENKTYVLPIYSPDLDVNSCYIYRDDINDGVYQAPNYFAAINNILLEEEISKFNLANTKNGWAPRVIVTIFGEYEPNELISITSDINRQYMGSDNAGKAVFLTAMDPAAAPKIETINLGLNDDSYVNLVVSTKEYILSAHKCTSPALAGLAINGGFEGQGSALEAAYNLYDSICISAYRNTLEKQLNKILEQCNTGASVVFDKKPLIISSDDEINNG